MPKASSLWEQFQDQKGAESRAVRRFTGRHIFRRDHYDLVSRAIGEEFTNYYIRNYYGIGGAGKSSLLRQLEAELLGQENPPKGKLPEEEFPEKLQEAEAQAFREARASCGNARERIQAWCQTLGRGKKPVVLRADFDDVALKAPQDVLLRFRAQLMQQYDKAWFPLFDVAMLRLAQKYGRRLPPDEQKEMLIDNPVISFALDTVGDLTGAGVLIGAAQTAAKVGKSVAQALAGRNKAIRKTNEDASRMDAPDLERRLPYYFAMDVNAMNLPLVCVYLDTYEKMTAQAEGEGWSTGFDGEWLRGEFGLVRNLGNAVFAIAGREKLEWGDLPVEQCHVEAQPVEALGPSESAIFLASCGIKDEVDKEGVGLYSRLYDLTGGEPVYLDLCVDEYEHLTASGKESITIENFGGDRERLVERHTRYISQNLQDALCLLAAMGSWTDGLCEELCRTLPIPSPEGTEYRKLTHLSYVQEDQEKGSWVMHRPVAEVLAGKLTPALRERLISALLNAAQRDTAALDILGKVAGTDCRAAQATERQAQADREAGRYPEARRWQKRAVELWKGLGDEYAARHGESLAALADILREQLNNQPTHFKPDKENAEDGEDALRERRGWQELRTFCEESISACEGLGDGLDEALARLWERKANAEDKQRDWDAAISSWERTLELGRKLECPKAVLLNARLQIGWDHWLSGQQKAARAALEDTEAARTALVGAALEDTEAARAALEDTLNGLKAQDREADRAYSPKTLLCAELLCQSYDDLNGGKWDEPLAQVQTWLRSLDYTLTGKESLEELLDWQDWIETGHAASWLHSGVGKEGADVPERLQRAADLDQQVIEALAKRLGEQHPTVLNAGMALANIYINYEWSKNTSAVLAVSARSLEAIGRPLGSVPEGNYCFLPDAESVLSICRKLVERYTASMGKEYPDTYAAKELLADAYGLAARPEDVIPLRQELWKDYSRIYGETSEEALQQNSLLIEANRRAGRWEEAIALQTRRLERAQAGEIPGPQQEHDSLCTLYLSRLWQDEELPQDRVRKLLTMLLALTKELKPYDRGRYLDSAWQWCLEYAGDELEDMTVAVALALADAVSSKEEVIERLEPWAEEKTLPAAQRCGVLFHLGRAYRDVGGARGAGGDRERSAELLEELCQLLEDCPEVEDPDRGTALLELGLARRKLARFQVDDSFQQTAKEMLAALREALAWREEHLPPEDPATDAARFQLADALTCVGVRKEAVPLLETLLASRRKALGETAEAAVEAELMLVTALARVEGRYEEALSLFRQAQRHMDGLRSTSYTIKDRCQRARYALYRGAGGELSFLEWQEAGEPERD